MLAHPRHSEQLTNRILAVLVIEEQADELDGDLRFDSVENSASYRSAWRVPASTSRRAGEAA